MPLQVIEQIKRSENINPVFNRKKIIEWKGKRMLAWHSFLSGVAQVISFSEEKDVVKIGVIGEEHSGKTTLAQAFAHAIHNGSKIPYAIRIFKREDLIDFENTLKKLTPANYILIFDDVSFLGASANKKQIEYLKAAITQIRHLPGGRDVKIIAFFNYHYTLGFDKYMRQSNYKIFTTVGSSELKNMGEIVGKENLKKVEKFSKMVAKCPTKKRFSYRIGGKDVFTYLWKDPFIPVLFWDNVVLRDMVSPTRQFLDPNCSICARAQGLLLRSEIPIKQFVDEGYNAFGKDVFRASTKQILLVHGINTYSRAYQECKKYIEKALMNKEILLEDLSGEMGFKERLVYLKKKLSKVFDEPEEQMETEENKNQCMALVPVRNWQ